MNIYKKCMLDQNLEGVAQKMRLPRPSEAQNWKGRGRLNFWATALKFCTSTYFSKIFKWYLYDIFIFPLVSYFEKMQKSDMSRLQWSLSYDIRWGKPGKTQNVPKINVKHHKIKISGGENRGKPGKTGENPPIALT